jgi:plastocyanin
MKKSREEIMKRRIVWLAGLMAAVVATVLLEGPHHISANQQPPTTTAEVKIDNFSFGPGTITVTAGTTVTWTNRDDIPHTVVSTDGVFKSKVMDTDEKFSYTFTKLGSFPYFCSIHPKMTGKVMVQ